MSKEKKIIEFKYSFGSYFSGYFNYKLKKISNDEIKIISNAHNVSFWDVELKTSIKAFEKIEKIIKENNLEKYNGFDESDDSILDGYDFYFFITFDDKSKIKITGYEKYPEYYDKWHKELVEVLEKLVHKDILK